MLLYSYFVILFISVIQRLNKLSLREELSLLHLSFELFKVQQRKNYNEITMTINRPSSAIRHQHSDVSRRHEPGRTDGRPCHLKENQADQVSPPALRFGYPLPKKQLRGLRERNTGKSTMQFTQAASRTLIFLRYQTISGTSCWARSESSPSWTWVVEKVLFGHSFKKTIIV